jgi:preprotein translocase subunit YajC
MLLPLIVLIGAMFLMTRSAKNKQRQAQEMRNQMTPGSGVRTIGGLYAVVKEIHDDTLLLELSDGVHAHFAKNAIGAVLADEEYARIVHGIEPDGDGGTPEEIDDAPAEARADTEHVDLSKPANEDEPKSDGTDPK